MFWRWFYVPVYLLCTCFDSCTSQSQQPSNSLDTEFEAIYTILASQQSVIETQAHSIEELREDNHALRNIVSQHTKHIQELESRVSESEGDQKNIFHEFGCEHEEITLSCQQSQWINVTYATYGMNSAQCGDTCCSPSPSDCSELVSENDIATWLSLKVACDNQASCTYQYSGSVINDCELSYVADYMHIFYDCLPDTAPIGFTARLSASALYQAGEIVIFDDVITNYGNHYQPSTGYFTCPRHGIYLIGLNLYSHDDNANLALMIQNDEVIEVWVATSAYIHAGGQIIQECNVGDIIWARADSESYVFSDHNAQSHFYATFLQSML